MSEISADPSERRSLVGGMIGRVVPAVLRQVDTNELIENLDINAIADELDLDALMARLDLDALVDRLDINAIANELDLDALMARLDLDALVDRLDINAIANELDLDTLMARLDLDALVDRLDINAIANQLDLDALMARLDLDALVDRLDINAIAEEIDLDALMKRIDMAQLTAGATQDVAVSGLDLVRRQLVRADATVEGGVDRLLHREPEGRPAAPSAIPPPPGAETESTSDELRRRDVSGHYAGPVTRSLALIGDISVAFALFGFLGAATSYFFNSLLDLELSIDANGWVGLTLFALWMLVWFSVPVAAFGRTVGMAVAGLAVLRRDGGVVGARAAVVRALVLPVALVIFLIGMIGMVVGRERRTLYDVAAGTIVVYDWGSRQAEQPVTIREQLSARARRRHPSESAA